MTFSMRHLVFFMSRLLLDKQGTLQEILQLFLCEETIPVVSFEKIDVDPPFKFKLMNTFDLY